VPEEQGLNEENRTVARRNDPPEGQLLLGPRHGAEDGAGRRAYAAYGDLDPVGPPSAKRRFIDYPRRARRGWTRWFPSWRLVLSLLLIVVAALCGAVLVKYSRTSLPSQQNADATFQTTVVNDTSGKAIGRFSAQTRFWKPLAEIPPAVQNAVLAAEDRTFRTNGGISFTGVVRAALNNVRGGARQGGSTITQQYVKNAFSSTTDRSWSRKIDEFFVSIKAAQQLSKNDILENYLNIIYFGRGCYGVEAAAQCYFGKPVAKLTPTQAAYLAGIIDGPELYDSGTPDARAAAKARWTYVLDGMVTQGWLSPAERAKAVFPKVKPRTEPKAPGADDQTQYLLAMVQQEARDKYKINEQDLQRGGYKISTSFDLQKMKDAADAVHQVLGPRSSWPSRTQVAVATVDATNGQVVSVYAGDGKRSQNAVTQDIVQAGSTFKPFALVAALEGKRSTGSCDPQAPGSDALSLRSRFDGHSPQKIKGAGTVRNFGNEQFGYIDLVTATAHSVNTVYVGLNRKVGPGQTEQVARCAGYPERANGLNDTPRNVLGSSAPHPLDVARAYATFAAQGVRHDTYWIKSITKNGDTVVPEQKGDDGTRVFDKGVMADATYAMQAVVKEGTGTYVSRLGRPVAGKTGTSEANKSAWFAGFTPQYATVVALYRTDKKGNPIALQPWGALQSPVVGGGYPARVWETYMASILQGTKVEDFPEPVFGGGTFNPAPAPAPSPTVAPSPSGSATPSPTLSPTPTASEPQPSPSDSNPTPEPSVTDTKPLPSPPGFPRPKPSHSPKP
jgi:membrane peptidoglycan carboxypeptidase